MCFGSPRGSAAAQGSRGRCGSNVEPLAAATACRGRAFRQRLIASPCSVCRFEQFGAAALRDASRFVGRSPRRPARAGTRDAAAPGPCGLGFGAAARQASAVFHAEADEHSSLYLREEATGPLTAGSLAKERSRGSPRGQPHTWTGHAVAAQPAKTMTKGRRRLKYALIITCTIACPVGLDNGEVCSGHGACAERVSKGID